MPQIIPIYIPTYISDQNYNPSRVLPRLFYYNGLIDCETYYIESGSLTQSGMVISQSKFPYFDNYNVVTGSFPTAGSKSLLFNNEAVSYGALPSSSLFTEYWDTYISLLYNPKTRLLTAKAIIPLADYVKMELNDIVNFRGSYYHLRAINNYSLKTGDCELQLLGPIIADTFYTAESAGPSPAPTGSGLASISWSFSESTAQGELRLYNNGSNFATITTPSSGNTSVSASRTINAELQGIFVPATGSTTSSVYVNGDASGQDIEIVNYNCDICNRWNYNNNFQAIDGTITYYSCTDGSTQSIYVPGDDVFGVTGSFCNCNSAGTPYQSIGTGFTLTDTSGSCSGSIPIVSIGFTTTSDGVYYITGSITHTPN